MYYAKGNNLDHIGNLTGCERLPATASKTTLEITLSAPRETTTIINIGTRVTADVEFDYQTSHESHASIGGSSLIYLSARRLSPYPAGKICTLSNVYCHFRDKL